MDASNLIRFAISWGPTIIFVVVLLFHFLLGLLRGKRKSLILAVQSFIIFMICFTLFVSLVNIKQIDELTFIFINKILVYFNTSLGQIFGVSNAQSIKDVIIAVLPDIIGYGKVVESLFTNNAAYLNTIVSLIYNLFFAFVCTILYFVLDFICFIVYLIFYNNKRYTNKAKALYRNNAQSLNISKNRFGGGCIGLLKGFVTGVILMSFIGSLFFIVGGEGTNESQDVKFDDPRINEIYTAYDALGGYANTGILKVLNNIKNNEDVPYYLFAFDLIYRGEYKDDLNNIHDNFILREEMSEYIKLSRRTFDLLLKYDTTDSLKAYISGDTSINVNDVLTNIFLDDGFSKEFRTVINEFETKTFLVNLTLGCINAIVLNLDSFGQQVTPQAKQLINILFNGENAIRVNDLIKNSDIKIVLNMVLDIMCYKGDVNNPNYNVEVVKLVLPSIRRLSLYNNSNLYTKLNPLLSECYANILENSFNQTFTPEGVKRAVNETKKLNIDWFKEIHLIVDNFDDLFKFYNNVYLKAFAESPNLSFINFLLDYVGENEDYLSLAKAILKTLSDSQAISYFVQYSTIMPNIINTFPENIRTNIPTNLNLANTYDENGNMIEAGELSSLFGAMLDIASDKIKKQEFIKLINFDFNNSSIKDLESIFTVFDEKILYRLSESRLLNYALTAILSNIELVPGARVYIPKDSLTIDVVDELEYKRIEKRLFTKTLNEMPELIRIVNQYFDGEFTTATIDKLLQDYKATDIVLANSIFEGTISNLLIYMISLNESVVLVDSLKNPETWVKNSELNYLIKSVLHSNISITELMSSNLDLEMIKKWLNSDSNADTISNSRLLQTNITYALSKINDIVLPYDCFEIKPDSINGNEFNVVTKDNISTLLKQIPRLFINNTLDIDYLVQNIDQLITNSIVESSFTYIVGKEITNNSQLVIGEQYKKDLNKNSFANDPENIWMKNHEGQNLVFALRSLLGYFTLDNLTNLNINDLKQQIFYLDELNYSISPSSEHYAKAKIYAVMASHIISYNLTKCIDDYLVPNLLSSSYSSILKEDGIYKANDFEQLIKTLKSTLNIYNLESITTTEIENLIFKDRYKLFEAYDNSNMFKAITCSQLGTLLDGHTHTNVLKAVSDKNGFVVKNELSALLGGLSVLGINCFNDMNNIKFGDSNSMNVIIKSMSIIGNSKIVRDIITFELDKLFISTKFIEPTNQAKEDIGSGVQVYKSNEISSLLMCILNTKLDLDNFDINNISINFISEMSNSTILRNSITKLLSQRGFKIPSSLLQDNIITQNALDSLQNDLKNLGISSLGNINTNSFAFNYEIVEALKKNEIFRFTFTHILMRNKAYVFTKDIVKVDTDYTNNTIYGLTNEEISGLHSFVIANGMTDTTLDNLELADLNLTSFEYSKLVMNSISKMIKINTINGSIPVRVQSAERKLDLDNNVCYVLNQNDINSFITATNAFANGLSGNVTLNIESLLKLDRSTMNKVLNSDIYYYAICYAFGNELSSICNNPSYKDVVLDDITNNNTIKSNVLTKDSILSLFIK